MPGRGLVVSYIILKDCSADVWNNNQALYILLYDNKNIQGTLSIKAKYEVPFLKYLL